MLRTSNPVLNADTFSDVARAGETGAVMTLRGVVAKTGLLLVLLMIAAAVTWNLALSANPSAVTPWMLGGLIGGFILALIISFGPTTAPYLSPVYAICEGLFLGAVSALTEARYPGVVLVAVALTFGTLASLLLLYASGAIRATENFRLGVISATGGICLLYLVSMVMRLFGWNMPYIHETGLIGIGFSVFVVILAALNLVLDFDFIESGVESQAPRYMEWYGAFGLMVTLIWLYLEILRLLSKLRRR
jgi:uncharacterized YccA/Bax inhibitor family protein